MAETIEDFGGGAKWHWHNMMKDLKTQGGLPGVVIDPTSVNEHGSGGVTATGTHFYVTWVKDQFLLLSMDEEELELVEAFAKVVEYRPFCRYRSRKSGLLTFEWDKKDPAGRLAELRDAGEQELREAA